MAGVDELENLANHAEQYERKTEEAQKFESPDKENTQVIVSGVSPEEAAGNMAETILQVGFGVCQFLLDPRLQYDVDEVAAAREKLAPVIQKYNLAVGGTGRLPWIEEIMAGLYLGGLYKRIKRVLSEIRAYDKAKREAETEANSQANNNQNQANSSYYGEARKHQSQESSHPVPSEVGVRQESNPNPNERFL